MRIECDHYRIQDLECCLTCKYSDFYFAECEVFCMKHKVTVTYQIIGGGLMIDGSVDSEVDELGRCNDYVRKEK